MRYAGWTCGLEFYLNHVEVVGTADSTESMTWHGLYRVPVSEAEADAIAGALLVSLGEAAGRRISATLSRVLIG